MAFSNTQFGDPGDPFGTQNAPPGNDAGGGAYGGPSGVQMGPGGITGQNPSNPTGGAANNNQGGAGGAPGGLGGSNAATVYDPASGTYMTPAQAAAAGVTTSDGASTGIITKLLGSGSGAFGTSLAWKDLINAALAVYGITQAGKPPNFAIAPMTPQEQWRLDTSKNLYDSVAGMTSQYMQGLGSGNLQPNWSMPSDKIGNPAFMGGIQIPKFNFTPLAPSGAPPSAGGAGGVAPTTMPTTMTPDRIKVDPATGAWSVDNPTADEKAWLAAVNATHSSPGSTGAAPQTPTP